ncbi:MAG: zinc-binding dehydrogenase [Beutenbergiaceae bacterium]
MRALVLQEFGRMSLIEVPTPAPEAGEVLIAVAATGICGTDIHGYTGQNGRRSPGQVMGHESAGHIEATGPGSNLTIGAPVTFNPVMVPAQDAASYAGREQHHPDAVVIGVAPQRLSAFADFVIVPERNVVALPPQLPIELGALVEPLAVATHAVRRVVTESDRSILVLGGGPIGQSIVVALRATSAREVIVSEPDPARRALCVRLGAQVIDPAVAPVAEQLDRPSDVTLDAVGINASLTDALRATRLGGSVCLVGMGSQQLTLAAFDISASERTLVGSFAYASTDFARAADLVTDAAEGLRPLISAQIEPEAVDATMAVLAAGDGPAGKVLIRFDGGGERN